MPVTGCVSVVTTVSADGEVLPTMLVYEEKLREIASNMKLPADWTLRYSEDGN